MSRPRLGRSNEKATRERRRALRRYILAFYAIRAVANFHTMSQQNYFLDLTLYGEPARIRRLSATTFDKVSNDDADPGDRLMSKALVAPVGMKDVQEGSVGASALTTLAGVVGRVTGGALVLTGVSIRGILCVTVAVRTAAQLVIWTLPETHRPQPGDPESFLDVFELALRESHERRRRSQGVAAPDRPSGSGVAATARSSGSGSRRRGGARSLVRERVAGGAAATARSSGSGSRRRRGDGSSVRERGRGGAAAPDRLSGSGVAAAPRRRIVRGAAAAAARPPARPEARPRYDLCLCGWQDMKRRWATDEPLLLDFTKYVFVVFAAWMLFLPIFFLNVQYKYFSCYTTKKSKEERASLVLLMIPFGILGFAFWICHHRNTRRKQEFTVMWKYQLILSVDVFLGSFTTSFGGVCVVMAVAIMTLAPTGLPGYALWVSQAPVDKQGRLGAISGILITFGVVIPCTVMGVVLFMLCVGQWGPGQSYSTDQCAARRNDMRPAGAMACCAPLFFASAYYLWRGRELLLSS